jgi:hypothetical protein
MPVYILHGIANPWLEQNDPPRPKNTATAAHSVSYFESQNGPAAQPDRAAVPDLSRRFVVDKRLYARSLRAKSELKNFPFRVARSGCTLAFRSGPMNGH